MKSKKNSKLSLTKINVTKLNQLQKTKVKGGSNSEVTMQQLCNQQ
ncbi:hypothetical protein SAMN04488508_104307 [Aquimarina spongiae]|uniref:Uncharacterized protein n=1 Tax=Aquimarina spongiae TaxID=570521 RepID=A0A1M6FIV2_9FLAO|nr:hypothetical protein SAMN04488508_104307 [Aquimarina spongiae]